MAFTDQDEADLKAIASKKAGYFSKEYGRQFKGKPRGDAPAAPRSAPVRPGQDQTVTDEMKLGADGTYSEPGNYGSSIRGA